MHINPYILLESLPPSNVVASVKGQVLIRNEKRMKAKFMSNFGCPRRQIKLEQVP